MRPLGKLLRKYQGQKETLEEIASVGDYVRVEMEKIRGKDLSTQQIGMAKIHAVLGRLHKSAPDLVDFLLRDERKLLDRPEISIHEAGHAVVSAFFGLRFGGVRIWAGGFHPSGFVAGEVFGPAKGRLRRPRNFTHERKEIIVLLAGPMAEAKQYRYSKKKIAGFRLDGWQGDYENARTVAGWLFKKNAAPLIVASLERSTKAILNKPATWAAVLATAKALQDKGELTEADVIEIVKAEGKA